MKPDVFAVLMPTCGGGNIAYTEYPDLDHNCWDKTYGDAKVIAWLLAQRKPWTQR